MKSRLLKFLTLPRQRRRTVIHRSNHPTTSIRAPDREPAGASISSRELRTIFDNVQALITSIPPETSLELSEIEEMAKTDGIELRTERIFRKDDPEESHDAHRVRVAKLCFLYAKKLFARRTEAERKQIYECLVQPGHVRMNKLFVTTGDKTFDEKPDCWQSFPTTESDPRGLGLWAGPYETDFSLLQTNMGAFTVFAHHGITIKQRLQQLSGTCFLQAPIVLQAYLINKHTRRPADMMDMSKYVRHYLPTKWLGKYLWKGSGDSLKFLESILHGRNGQFGRVSILMNYELDSDDSPGLFKMLKQYGPALITNFRIEEDFVGGTRVIFDGEPTFGTPRDSEQLRHAMLLVGIRMDPVTREWRLLLQNWWRNKQFIEVSFGYMAKCEAKVSFVLTPQERMMSNVEHYSENFAESTVDDGGDEDWDDDWEDDDD